MEESFGKYGKTLRQPAIIIYSFPLCYADKDDTVSKYVGYIEEVFLFSESRRYNIKRKK